MSNFKFNSESLETGLDGLKEKTVSAVFVLYSTEAKIIQQEMKQKRLWIDRSGLAKSSLRANVSVPQLNRIRITLSHGVNYGIWLELANEQNYAIIIPTVKRWGPKILERLNGLLSKIKV